MVLSTKINKKKQKTPDYRNVGFFHKRKIPLFEKKDKTTNFGHEHIYCEQKVTKNLVLKNAENSQIIQSSHVHKIKMWLVNLINLIDISR